MLKETTVPDHSCPGRFILPAPHAPSNYLPDYHFPGPTIKNRPDADWQGAVNTHRTPFGSPAGRPGISIR